MMAGDDREQQHAERQRHGDNVAAIDIGEGVEIDVEMILRRAVARRWRRSIAAILPACPDVPLRSRRPLLPPTNHWDFTHKRNRAERVQIVNAGDGGEVLQAGL